MDVLKRFELHHHTGWTGVRERGVERQGRHA